MARHHLPVRTGFDRHWIPGARSIKTNLTI
jgi:hypothetical protein